MSYKLDHIHFRCEDVEKAVEFYIRMFHGKVTRKLEGTAMPITWMDIGGTTYCFSPKRAGMEIAPRDGGPQWGVFQIGLVTEDLEKTFHDLKAKGGEFEKEPFEMLPGVKGAFMKGPDGVQIELLQFS